MSAISKELLNDCELEPLAFSGLIQNHGALLFLDKVSGTFTYGSENLADFVGESCQELLGTSGDEWIEEMLPDLAELPTGIGNRIYLARALDLGEGDINVLISPTSDGWIIEFEFAQEGASEANAPSLPHLSDPNDTTQIKAVHQAVVDGLAQITGYDRVMLYQFLPDWSGEVLAESVLRSTGTYLSLRFPASDIPAIARGLYAQAPYRYIPLATNDTVNIVGRASDGKALDLTWSDLRSVSPVHIQYLNNMNVFASFSISIMVGGKLWGLIASHNDAPGDISLPARLACTKLIQKFVSRVETQRTNQKQRIAEEVGRKLRAGLATASETSALANAVVRAVAELSDQIEFNECIVEIDSNIASINQIEKNLSYALIKHLEANDFDEICVAESLPEDFQEIDLAHLTGVSGYASLKVRAPRAGNALVTVILTRPEEAGEVAWAGNPQKPVEVSDSGGIKLSPRESFEKWVQVRKGMCRTWNEDDLFVLNLLRDQLADALK